MKALACDKLLDRSHNSQSMKPKLGKHLLADLVAPVHVFLPVSIFLWTCLVSRSWRSMLLMSNYEKLHLDICNGNARATHYIVELCFPEDCHNWMSTMLAHHYPLQQWHLMPTLWNLAHIEWGETLVVEWSLQLVLLVTRCLLVCDFITRCSTDTKPREEDSTNYYLFAYCLVVARGGAMIFSLGGLIS